MSAPAKQIMNTPRTDAQLESRGSNPTTNTVNADFARTLERELGEAKARGDDYGQKYAKTMLERDQLKLDIIEIRRQHKQEADEWKTDEEVEQERD